MLPKDPDLGIGVVYFNAPMFTVFYIRFTPIEAANGGGLNISVLNDQNKIAICGTYWGDFPSHKTSARSNERSDGWDN